MAHSDEKKADIVALDVSLLDARKGKNLLGTLIVGATVRFPLRNRGYRIQERIYRVQIQANYAKILYPVYSALRTI